MALFSTTWY